MKDLVTLISVCTRIGGIGDADAVFDDARVLFKADCLVYAGSSVNHSGMHIHASPGDGGKTCVTIQMKKALNALLSEVRDRMLPVVLDPEGQGGDLLKMHGANGGVLAPLHGPLGQYAGLFLFARWDAERWENFLRSDLTGFHHFGLAFFEKIIGLTGWRKADNDTALTNRERETLYWCAQGKSYWETSVILGISERTVNHHMKMVRAKLRVQTNAQAVGKAAAAGILHMDSPGDPALDRIALRGK